MRPDVLNHNVETVARLQRAVRPSAGYARSLGVLARAKAAGLTTKTGFMVGLGETDDEIDGLLADLADLGVDIVTIGQYLRPTSHHLPIVRYAEPAEFDPLEAARRGVRHRPRRSEPAHPVELPRQGRRRVGEHAGVGGVPSGASFVVTRWSPEQVEAIAPSPAALSAARPLTTVTKWGGLGADDRAVWGSCRGSGAEPYDTMVDHVGVGVRCTCPSRRHPCKHVLALLLLWSNGDVADATPAHRGRRLARCTQGVRHPYGRLTRTHAQSTADRTDTDTGNAVRDQSDDAVTASRRGGRTSQRRYRIATGLATSGSSGCSPGSPNSTGGSTTGCAPVSPTRRWRSTPRGTTWRPAWSMRKRAAWPIASAGWPGSSVRRPTGTATCWPNSGLLHLLAQAGRRLGSLPGPLADAVATTVGWQVRQADVLAGVPDTDTWVVAARSDTREDRIEVRRHWLRGVSVGALGAAAVVRCVPPEPRHVA